MKLANEKARRFFENMKNRNMSGSTAVPLAFVTVGFTIIPITFVLNKLKIVDPVYYVISCGILALIYTVLFVKRERKEIAAAVAYATVWIMWGIGKIVFDKLLFNELLASNALLAKEKSALFPGIIAIPCGISLYFAIKKNKWIAPLSSFIIFLLANGITIAILVKSGTNLMSSSYIGFFVGLVVATITYRKIDEKKVYDNKTDIKLDLKEVLNKSDDDPTTIKTIMRLLDSGEKDPIFSSTAVRLLQNSKKWKIRFFAIHILKRLEYKEAIPLLKQELFNDEKWRAKKAAEKALLEFGRQDIVDEYYLKKADKSIKKK